MLVLSTDKVESLAYKYRTLFEQSEKLVRIAAENFDKDGGVLESSQIITSSKINLLLSERFNDDGTLKNTSGLVTSSDLSAALDDLGIAIGHALDDYVKITAFSGLFAQAVSEDGNIVKQADISAFVTEDTVNGLISHIHLGADRISLEGLITANANFKVLEDGSIETNNAKIKGYVYSVFKQIEESDATQLGYNPSTLNVEFLLNTNLYVNATFSGVVLPVSAAYEGARVVIMDSYFVKVRTATPPTTIRTADGSKIVSGLFKQKYSDESPYDHMMFQADFVEIDCGAVELVLQNLSVLDQETGEVKEQVLQWVLISNSCQKLGWRLNDKWYEYNYNIH